MGRTFPVWRASAAATFFLALCSRDSSADGGTTAAVFLLALWPPGQVSEQAQPRRMQHGIFHTRLSMTSHTSMLMTSFGAAAQDHEILVVAICGLRTYSPARQLLVRTPSM